MRIATYRTELNEDKHNVLVKENSCNYPTENLNDPISIANMFNEVFKLNKQAEEHVYMLARNIKGRVLGVFEISHGTENMSFCNPREIFIRALLCGASSIVLVHNHPSGDCAPSDDDIRTYERIKACGEWLGIELDDNIIIGDDIYSFFKVGYK